LAKKGPARIFENENYLSITYILLDLNLIYAIKITAVQAGKPMIAMEILNNYFLY